MKAYADIWVTMWTEVWRVDPALRIHHIVAWVDDQEVGKSSMTFNFQAAFDHDGYHMNQLMERFNEDLLREFEDVPRIYVRE